jgi:Spy/CpxP family protein refolding chaperone
METTNLQSDQPQSSPATPRRSGHRRRWWMLLAIPLAAGFVSMSVARAQHPGGPFHGGKGGAFMQERIDHLLTAAGATDAQKTQIKSIWDGLRPQLKAAHQQHEGLRKQIGQAIAAATIDPAQVEKLRQQSVAAMDKISALITQGMVSSAQVLTADQRQLVLQKIEEHHRHGPDGAN